MKKVTTTIGGFVVALFGGFDVKNATIAMLSFFCGGVAAKKSMAVCCHLPSSKVVLLQRSLRKIYEKNMKTHCYRRLLF
jgi:hypothetical protein